MSDLFATIQQHQQQVKHSLATKHKSAPHVYTRKPMGP